MIAVAQPVIMPFGRYGGLPLVQLDTDYLLWLEAKVKLAPSLRRAVQGELARRHVPVPGEGKE